MKILLINTDDNLGGAAIACKRLLSTLNESPSVEAKMLVLNKNTSTNAIFAFANSWIYKKIAFLKFSLERLYFTFFEKSKNIRFAFSPANAGFDISQHPLVKEADILHLHWINFGFLSISDVQKLLSLGKPIVWTLHDMWLMTGGCHHSGTCENFQNTCGNCERYLKNPSSNDLSHQVWEKKNKILRDNLPLKIVTCSQWLGNRAMKSSLLKKYSITSIPNPIETELFKPFDKNEAKTILNLDINKKYILFVAAKISVIWKGFSYFIEALHNLNESLMVDNEAIELLILGESEESIIDLLPYPVHRLGRINDFAKINQIYNAATMFVIPSLEENLPNTIMESLSCGTPAVGFRTGGIPEMIDHHINGVVADYKSAESLSEGMSWVLNHPDYNSLCQNARKKVMNCYDQKIVAEKYINLYFKTLDKSV